MQLDRLQVDAMTLDVRTVPADSRPFLQRAAILDGMIAASPSWTDQFNKLRLSSRSDGDGLKTVFAQKARRRSIRAYTQQCRSQGRDIGWIAPATSISNWMKHDQNTKIQEMFHA